MFFTKVFAVGLLTFNLTSIASASADCSDLLVPRTGLGLLADMSVTHFDDKTLDNINTQLSLARSYRDLVKTHAQFEAFDAFFSGDQVMAILNDDSARLYQLRLIRLLEKVNVADLSGPNAMDQLLAEFLHNKVPETSIATRIASLKASHGKSLKAVQQALGEMELNELQTLVHGGDPLHPTRESLIGQYLERTGASTLEYSFPTTARKNDRFETRGAPKLVISLSKKSAAVYHELFGGPDFLIHHHTTHQGTLYIAHNGFSGSYMQITSPYKPEESSIGTLMSHILLPTQEAQRMLLIDTLGSINYFGRNFRESWQIPNYCKMGGYNSCTHWVGNLPIGRNLVLQAKHPGKVDDYANNNVGKGPQISDFQSYDPSNLETWKSLFYQRGDETDRAVATLKKYLPLVWKNDGKGVNMSLSEMLGPNELEANLAGEYANPGYVAHRLTGNVSNDHVPFVFRVVKDHTQPLTSRMKLMIDAH